MNLHQYDADPQPATTPAAHKPAKHVIPPQSIALIQATLNNAGNALKHSHEGMSWDCFEAARRLTLLADERAALLAALKQIVAMLTQPVQFTDSQTPAGTSILRGDAAAAVKSAQAAIALASGGAQ